jgi:hypothetical protein
MGHATAVRQANFSAIELMTLTTNMKAPALPVSNGETRAIWRFPLNQNVATIADAL